jgi:fermentation-respiration switch protein FrsA (DUF1100 family)
MLERAVSFRADGLDLEGAIVVPPGARAMLILCHGTPSGAPPDPDDPGYPGLARALADRGFGAMWFNFRGCREAPGDFSFAGWCRDLEAAIDLLAGRGDTRALERVLVGSSMGGMAAITVAARRVDVAAVATLAAVASMTFDDLVPDAAHFVHEARNRGIIRDPAFPPDLEAWAAEFDDLAADRHVAAIAPRPVLLIHGDADLAVSYAHAERLFSLAKEPKELVRLPVGGHQLRRDARAIDALVDWLERLGMATDIRFVPQPNHAE